MLYIPRRISQRQSFLEANWQLQKLFPRHRRSFRELQRSTSSRSRFAWIRPPTTMEPWKPMLPRIRLWWPWILSTISSWLMVCAIDYTDTIRNRSSCIVTLYWNSVFLEFAHLLGMYFWSSLRLRQFSTIIICTLWLVGRLDLFHENRPISIISISISITTTYEKSIRKFRTVLLRVFTNNNLIRDSSVYLPNSPKPDRPVIQTIFTAHRWESSELLISFYWFF